MTDLRFMLDVLVKQRQFKAQECWNRRQLEVHQACMLGILRRDAYEKSPFYHEFHQGRYDAPLDQLPVLTNAQMVDNFDCIVTDRAVRLDDVNRYMEDPARSRYFLERYVINATFEVSPYC